MSFTLNVFDARRAGLKIPYALPAKQVSDGGRHEFASPFKWTKAEGSNPRPPFLEELEPPANTIDAKAQHLRSRALRVLSGSPGSVTNLLEYYQVLREFARITAAAAPKDEIDPSLPNHEQDRLMEEREQHAALAEAIHMERLKLLYNTAVFSAREGYKGRFVADTAAERSYQQAAALFDFVANHPYLPEEGVPNELAPDFLRVMALCSLAGAAEHMLMTRVEHAAQQWEQCSHLCYSISYYYSQVCSLLTMAKKQMERAAGVSCFESLLNLASVKTEYFRGAAWWHYSFAPDAKRVDLRRRKAAACFEAALVQLGRRFPGARKATESELEYCTKRARTPSASGDAAAAQAGARTPLTPATLTEEDKRPTPALNVPDWLLPEVEEVARLAQLAEAGDEEGEGELALNQDMPESPKPISALEPSIAPPKGEQGVGRLGVEVVVPQEDLFHKTLPPRVDERGQPLKQYHECAVMASVTPVPPAQRSTGLRLYMIFDTFAQLDSAHDAKPNKIVSVQDLLMLLVRIVGLTPADRVGVISWVDKRPRRSELRAMDEEGQARLLRDIRALQAVGNHRGSPGAAVVEGVSEALEGLEADTDGASLEVIVFSDGFDSTGATHYTNWLNFCSMRQRHAQILKGSGRLVRVHTFALGLQSERYLLKAIAAVCHGDFSYAESSQDGLSVLRSWFLRHIANQMSKVATRCTMKVECFPGVKLRHLNKYELVFDPNYEHKFQNDADGGEVELEDFSEDHETHVVMVLGIPADQVQKGVTDLVKVQVRYREAQTGQINTVSAVGRQEASNDLISREMHSWLPAAYVASVEGAVMVSGSGGGRGMRVNTGDILDMRDCVEVLRSGKAFLMTADDTRIVLLERSSLVIKSLEPGELRASYSLTKGHAFVVTGQEASVELVVMEPRFKIIVQSASHCKVEFDQRTRMVKVNCMSGRATILTTKGEHDTRATDLLALQQTQMTDKQSPLSPWAIEEESYREWLSADGINSNFLQAKVSMGSHICRTVVSEWIGRASRWLYKGSWERLTESKANRRCREFLIRFWLRESKNFLTNNIAGLSPATEEIRKYVDKAIAIALGDRARARDNLYYMLSASASLQTERARGLCDVYTTPMQQRLFAECADAKAKEEREREAAERDRQRMMKDSETARREKALRALFPLCDLDGVGTAYFSSIMQAILGVEDAPKRVADESEAGAPGLLQPVLDRWEGVARLRRQMLKRQADARRWHIPEGPTCTPDTTGAMAFDENGFVRLWLHLSEELEGGAFNNLIELLHGVFDDLVGRAEGTRKGRAIAAVFRKWDTDGLGWLSFSEVADTLWLLYSPQHWYTRSWNQLVTAINTPPPEPIVAPKSPLSGASVSPAANPQQQPKDTPPPMPNSGGGDAVDTPVASPAAEAQPQQLTDEELAEIKVTMRRFNLALTAFFGSHSERAMHRELERIASHLASRRGTHYTVTRVVKHINRTAEKEHLVQWDLRHVFDGICQKDLQRVAQMDAKRAPPFIDHIAAPVCILCGIQPRKTVSSLLVNDGNDDFTDQWWEVLRSKIRRDASGFLEFLRHFPVLSVSYRQVMRVLRFTESSEFDSCRLLSYGLVLSNMCDWVRVLLKVAFLEHEWDFSNVVEHGAELPPKEEPAEIAEAPKARRASQTERPPVTLVLEGATASPTAPAVPEKKEKEEPPLPPPRCPQPRPQSATRKPHAAIPVNASFRGVVEDDSPVVRATTRFSRFAACSPDPAYGEAPLPERGDLSAPPKVRRTPVAAVLCEDRLSSVHLFDTPSPYCPTRMGPTSAIPQPRPPQRGPVRPSTAPIRGRPGAGRSAGPAICTPTPPPAGARSAYAASPQSQGTTQVGDFLLQHGLGELVETMNSEGYDDIVDLRDLAASDPSALERLVPRPGHRAKLGRLLNIR
eukprot:TRINITY_DN2647_c0_g5_i1.p1 TRINITY_DN2647_c0_g5~~TRINITY_DN2647_c0_g5_i1.p1  ORF type:complete len:1941 (+),score=668.41 TRINITY_DN2647_c0_g5_i1:104-5824(+)